MTNGRPQDPPAGLFGPVAHDRFPLGDRHFLVRAPRSGVEVILDVGAHQVLSLCEGFRTLDQHAARISARLSGGEAMRDRVRNLLGNFVAQQLLSPASELLLELGGEAREGSTTGMPPLRTLIIRTCDRPHALAQLFAGLRSGPHGQDPRFSRVVVVDDSRNADARARNRALCEPRSEAGAIQFHYHGPTEQARWVEELARSFPNHADTIAWLLAPCREGESNPTPGRALNHALLLAAGERVLLLDDDARLECRLPPEPEPAVQIGSVAQSARLLLDRDAMHQFPAAAHLNPAVAHGEFLGATLAAALSRLGQQDPLTEQALSDLELAESTRLHSSSPILVSVNGVFGDPGTEAARWLFEIDDARVWGPSGVPLSEERYRSLVTGRHAWRGHRGTVFLPDSALMLTAGVGLDNTRPLAPTLPEGRNEDLLLGDAIKALYPDAITVALPWGMSHLPEPARSWDSGCLDQPAQPGLPGLLAAFMRTGGIHCAAQTFDRRAAFLAQTLMSLADAGERELRERVLHELLSERSARVSRIQANLVRNGARMPEAWTHDAQRIIAANSRSAQTRGAPWQTEIGLGEAVHPDAAVARLRGALTHYAVALELWPRLWREAREKNVNALAED